MIFRVSVSGWMCLDAEESLVSSSMQSYLAVLAEMNERKLFKRLLGAIARGVTPISPRWSPAMYTLLG
jgi:hypothetical protein